MQYIFCVTYFFKNKFTLLSIIIFLNLNLYSQTSEDNFIRGVDISFNNQIEVLGGTFKQNGVIKNVLDIFKDNGVNYVRLRLWHTPKDKYSGLAETIIFAKKIKSKGFKILLDIHYSDWWADPGQQNKPAAWANLNFTALKESVYTYTKFVHESMKKENVLPEMVQIGNEISGGMLWPDGKTWGVSDVNLGWKQFGELLKEGIRGTKDGANGSPLKIMIHTDKGGDNSTCIWYFDKLKSQGVEFDIIGLSFYPWWHGTFEQLKYNLNDLATRYNKEIVVVETAYPWTTNWLNDGHGNVGVDYTKLIAGIPASPEGQKNFLISLRKIINETPNKKGIGFFYWEPAYISVSPIGSAWEHLTTFSFTGEALTSLSAFNLNLTNIHEQRDLTTSKYYLLQNYPNPFNGETIISYQIPVKSNVNLKIYDLLGKEVKLLTNEIMEEGFYTTKFNASELPSGIYYYKLQSNNQTEIKKMLLMK